MMEIGSPTTLKSWQKDATLSSKSLQEQWWPVHTLSCPRPMRRRLYSLAEPQLPAARSHLQVQLDAVGGAWRCPALPRHSGAARRTENMEAAQLQC